VSLTLDVQSESDSDSDLDEGNLSESWIVIASDDESDHVQGVFSLFKC